MKIYPGQDLKLVIHIWRIITAERVVNRDIWRNSRGRARVPKFSGITINGKSWTIKTWTSMICRYILEIRAKILRRLTSKLSKTKNTSSDLKKNFRMRYGQKILYF